MKTDIEVLALCLIVLGLGILQVTLSFEPEAGFGKISVDKAVLTGTVSSKIESENGWLYPMKACQQVMVWSEMQVNHTGLVEVKGSMDEGMFFASSIKPQ